MGRADPRFRADDVLRIFEDNLDLASKRLIIAWFFSLIPVKEPKVDVLGLLLELLAFVPIVSPVSKVFEIGLQTAQAAAELAELFQFEAEEDEVELARLRLELQSVEEAFRELHAEREDFIAEQAELRDRIGAFQATNALLLDAIRNLEDDKARILRSLSFHIGVMSRARDVVVRLANEEVIGLFSPAFAQAFNRWSDAFRRFTAEENLRG